MITSHENKDSTFSSARWGFSIVHTPVNKRSLALFQVKKRDQYKSPKLKVMIDKNIQTQVYYYCFDVIPDGKKRNFNAESM